MGAGAAIRDAADLLNTTIDGSTTLVDAIGRFEAGMRQRGGEVLTLAMKTVRWILATDTTFGAATTAVADPILAAATRLRHQLPTPTTQSGLARGRSRGGKA